MVAHRLAQPSSDTFFLKGFVQFTVEVKQTLGVVVCSCAVADTLLRLPQGDGRVLRQLDLLAEELHVAQSHVPNLSDFVIRSVSAAMGVSLLFACDKIPFALPMFRSPT